ncbi:CDP-glucose 4,6-dehydratase [Vibrio breoganii]|uniref:CDP-glucose 4,6-dehydratase n=1 Tax=Vibrio breoganii TaxID=553239 RepID=UPI000C8250AF|nr:CDP-glucose 4,6-dehydratase [Vibrio breoganii]PMM49039.1 CDP-glucose 4,6-dehydratase [Vibrio breoganii]
MSPDFWQGKKVFVTGHTGFKGGWLCLWLQEMGAVVKGYSLPAPTTPSLFEEAKVWERMLTEEGDIRDFTHLRQVMSEFEPEIVFHMAAQPLVRLSYDEPMETYSTNVMGTVYLLEAVKQVGGVKAVVNITSDKCYENREWVWGYREDEAMGGYDPYSNSKGCAELVASSYRQSFFNKDKYNEHGCALASVRAGNVIGGGDWADDRLIPDMLNAFSNGQSVEIRSPYAIRPWQHVLEPLSGYLTIAEYLYLQGSDFAEGWNFGPKEEDAKPVEWIVERLVQLWGDDAKWFLSEGEHPHEAHYLKLDCSKAKMRLNWQPVWDLNTTLEKIVGWQKAWLGKEDMKQYTINEIREYMNARVSN